MIIIELLIINVFFLFLSSSVPIKNEINIYTTSKSISSIVIEGCLISSIEMNSISEDELITIEYDYNQKCSYDEIANSIYIFSDDYNHNTVKISFNKSIIDSIKVLSKRLDLLAIENMNCKEVYIKGNLITSLYCKNNIFLNYKCDISRIYYCEYFNNIIENMSIEHGLINTFNIHDNVINNINIVNSGYIYFIRNYFDELNICEYTGEVQLFLNGYEGYRFLVDSNYFLIDFEYISCDIYYYYGNGKKKVTLISKQGTFDVRREL